MAKSDFRKNFPLGRIFPVEKINKNDTPVSVIIAPFSGKQLYGFPQFFPSLHPPLCALCTTRSSQPETKIKRSTTGCPAPRHAVFGDLSGQPAVRDPSGLSACGGALRIRAAALAVSISPVRHSLHISPLIRLPFGQPPSPRERLNKNPPRDSASRGGSVPNRLPLLTQEEHGDGAGAGMKAIFLFIYTLPI